jgi:hypothetical protein
VFAINSDRFVSSFGIEYSTVEEYPQACAGVYEEKYIINLSDGNGDINNIEYMYDKNKFWIKKDNESNSVYFQSIDKIFAGSALDGTIIDKCTGYTNNGIEYLCYFVTKRFRLTEFENLFRFIKFMYASEIPVTVSYSVDDEPFVDFEAEPNNGKIYEIRETLSGIVRGQSIKIKVSFMSNATTEIHRIVLLWDALRELNRR